MGEAFCGKKHKRPFLHAKKSGRKQNRYEVKRFRVATKHERA